MRRVQSRDVSPVKLYSGACRRTLLRGFPWVLAPTLSLAATAMLATGLASRPVPSAAARAVLTAAGLAAAHLSVSDPPV